MIHSELLVYDHLHTTHQGKQLSVYYLYISSHFLQFIQCTIPIVHQNYHHLIIVQLIIFSDTHLTLNFPIFLTAIICFNIHFNHIPTLFFKYAKTHVCLIYIFI